MIDDISGCMSEGSYALESEPDRVRDVVVKPKGLSTPVNIWLEPIRVAGISMRVKHVQDLDGNEVELVREPKNPEHARAIMVWLLGVSGRKHIGYVPRELADMVKDEQLPTRGVIVWRTEPSQKVGVRIQA